MQFDRIEAARVHHAARRRGGVAARGARAAAGEIADDRLPGRGHVFHCARGPRPLCSGCANLAGSRAAPSRSSIDGRRDAASATPKSRPSSSASRWMSSSRREALSPQQSRRHRQSRSYSRWRSTRSGSASSQAWRDRAATSPACRPSARYCRQAARNLARGGPGFPPIGDHRQCRLSRRRAGNR